jgi:hypothetical protein
MPRPRTLLAPRPAPTETAPAAVPAPRSWSSEPCAVLSTLAVFLDGKLGGGAEPGDTWHRQSTGAQTAFLPTAIQQWLER